VETGKRRTRVTHPHVTITLDVTVVLALTAREAGVAVS
jgi:hypothetical protein